MSVVIADAGPVHYLILIEQVALLPKLFERVFIPVTVREELLDCQNPDAVRQRIAHPPAWLQVLPDPTPLLEAPILTCLDRA